MPTLLSFFLVKFMQRNRSPLLYWHIHTVLCKGLKENDQSKTLYIISDIISESSPSAYTREYQNSRPTDFWHKVHHLLVWETPGTTVRGGMSVIS